MTSTFNEAEVVRDSTGKFGEKQQTTPETTLVSPVFVTSPLAPDDVAFGREHAGAVAHALHERTGWDTLVLAVGDGWAHDAVRLPDGRILDASGVSDGRHISDDDGLRGKFSSEEIHGHGEPELVDNEAFLALSDDERPYLPQARRIADELMTWVGAEDAPADFWLVVGDDHESELVAAASADEALGIAGEAFSDRYGDDADVLTVVGGFRGEDSYTDELVFVPSEGTDEREARRAIRNHS